MLPHKNVLEIFFPVLFFSILWQIIDGHQSGVVRSSAHYKFSTRASYFEKSLDCSCPLHGPNISKAFYGFEKPPKTKSCDLMSLSDFKDQRHVHDLTNMAKNHCDNTFNTSNGKQTCMIPRMNALKGISGENRLYWLICFSCSSKNDNIAIMTKNQSQDDFQFHKEKKRKSHCDNRKNVNPITDIRNASVMKPPPEVAKEEIKKSQIFMVSKDKPIEEKNDLARTFINKELHPLISKFKENKFPNVEVYGVKFDENTNNGSQKEEEGPIKLENKSEFLETAELTIGTISNILNDEEKMDLKIDGLGKVQVSKSKEEAKEFELKEKRVAINLPPQESIRNEDNSTIVSVIIYSERVSQSISLGHNMSDVVSVSALDSQGISLKATLDKDISIKLMHAKSIEDQVFRCVYWDFSQHDWSDKGCKVIESGPDFTTCSCSHLTNFAVMMEILPSGHYSEDALRIVSLVCCTLSALALVASIVYFLQHRGSEMNDRVKINTHFCFNLLMVQLIMIFGINQTDVSSMCKVIAISLHYFLMATFTWSLLSGHQIYILLVEVFDTENKKMKLYYAIGYLFPLFMVALGVLVDFTMYDGISYGSANLCWMITDNVIYYAFFLAPLCIVLFINISMLALVIAKVYKIKPRPHMYNHARGWFSMALLLGCTWFFGLFGQIVPGIVSGVLFVVLNSLQGLLIFIFHVILGQRCRNKIENSSIYHTFTTRTGSGSSDKSTHNKSKSRSRSETWTTSHAQTTSATK